MTHTTIVDESARGRRFENRLNEVYRHCRIGKVTRKMQTPGGKWVSPMLSWHPDPGKPPTSPFFSGGYVHTTSSGDVVL